MRYISTRGQAPALSFEEAMLSGLARDGGLYVPETIPAMSAEDIRALHGLSYEETAFRVMRPFVGDGFTDETFGDLIAKAYAGFGHNARAPLVQLAPGHFLLELFHGPTLAFKDVALQLLGLQGLCIGNGILTVENREQAVVRADPDAQNKGGGAAAAALHLVALGRKWGGQSKGVGFRPATESYRLAGGDDGNTIA